MKLLAQYLKRTPLIAILRGIQPADAVEVGNVLVENGFCLIEVPLNSPEPYQSIALLAEKFGEQALIGAGTALNEEQVLQVQQAGGKLIVSPHFSAAVVLAAKAYGLYCIPGIATPSEGFAALQAGADALKLFPAELITPSALKAMRAVFPADTLMLPVGGINPENLAAYWQAGADGFGLGSALFKPTMSLHEIDTQAKSFSQAIRACR